ncbi:hypothetical protein [Brachyspira hyodysenteriae]|uniref:hypothetical protein n=1 Tax=Brachyspira hyodysenteriae TaxID=159 RepID=UPI0022CDF21C|nr:hypothetical protein [Brachyspira hyodysenteriae]MDA0058181.1 hypothetical protein [Brachyspira hyodysenteriae]
MSEKNKVTLTGFDEFRKTLEELGIDFKNEAKKSLKKRSEKNSKRSQCTSKSKGLDF